MDGRWVDRGWSDAVGHASVASLEEKADDAVEVEAEDERVLADEEDDGVGEDAEVGHGHEADDEERSVLNQAGQQHGHQLHVAHRLQQTMQM